MSRLGPVRAVEVIPSAPRDRDLDDPSTDGGGSSAASSASTGARHKHTNNGRTAAAAAATTGDFDVNALLSNMPKPRALAKGNKRGGGRFCRRFRSRTIFKYTSAVRSKICNI